MGQTLLKYSHFNDCKSQIRPINHLNFCYINKTRMHFLNWSYGDFMASDRFIYYRFPSPLIIGNNTLGKPISSLRLIFHYNQPTTP